MYVCYVQCHVLKVYIKYMDFFCLSIKTIMIVIEHEYAPVIMSNQFLVDFFKIFGVHIFGLQDQMILLKKWNRNNIDVTSINFLELNILKTLPLHNLMFTTNER